MTTGLHAALQLGGLGALLGLELCAAGFRRGAFGAGDPARQRRNLAYLVAALATAGLSKALVGPIQARVPALLDPSAVHPLLDLAACFLVADLIGWVSHHVKHRFDFLWRFHFQHHRESAYDVWLITHTHAVEVVVSGAILLTLLSLLGFSRGAVETYLVLYTLAKTYQHSSFDLTLGRVIDRVIVGPAYHRLHHEVGSRCNYGNVLTLWDVVFETARWPASRHAPDVPLGAGDGPEPYGFAAELAHSFRPLEPRVEVAEAPALPGPAGA
jgi:sterol desaturase/sphingolipid hydroxylase (fatty acid hydroxylase superfamily)